MARLEYVILTRGRPHEQRTYDFLVATGFHPTLVVNSEEDAGGRPHVVFPHGHVGEVRQRVLEEMGDRVMMLDDDLAFHRVENGRVIPMKTAEWSDLVYDIESALDEFAHVGLADRFMAHTRIRPREYNKRYIKAICYNRELFPDLWPEFRLPVSEDLDFNLQLLAEGRPNCILTEWAVSDKGQYKPGGCQHYRTDAVELGVCRWMEEAHPGIYSFVTDSRGRHRSRVAWRNALKTGGGTPV